MQESLAKFVTFPLWTLKLHSPASMTLKALVMLNLSADLGGGTVITKELIVPIARERVLFSFWY